VKPELGRLELATTFEPMELLHTKQKYLPFDYCIGLRRYTIIKCQYRTSGHLPIVLSQKLVMRFRILTLGHSKQEK
jgi:hypothetical protein